MSEPDDKPEPDAGAANSGAGHKSLFDSDWDALLGSASASVSRPIFAPPKTAPLPITPEPEPEPEVDLRPAESVPRSSDARASVSGAFLAPKPRPEPANPPRYEPPEGVSPEYDNADDVTEDHLPILPPPGVAVGPSTEDDDEPDAEPGDPLAQVIELASKKSAAEAKPRARPPEPQPDSELERESGSRKLSIAIGVIAAAVLIAAYVGKSRERAEPDATQGELDRTPTKEPSEPEVAPRPAIVDDGSALGTDTGEGETDAGETDTGETGGPSEPPTRDVDPRDPSVIPPGTPEENAKAFLKLPVSRLHDGPPVGGIGRSGVHVDAISTSRGRENTDCDQPTESFSLGVAKYVNVCFRVVHPREPEMLRVIWEKDGKVTRRGRVRIPDLHAYTTRAYLLLRPEYIGNWRVRIVPEGEESVDLAVAEFVITE